MKVMKIVGIVCLGLLLTACSTRQGPPAEVTDANGLSDASSAALIKGLGPNINLVGQDAGPTQGVLGVRSFFFDFDENVVHDKYLPVIKAHANYLMSHERARVLLEGNTDSRGSHEYNIALGQRRANAVAEVLRMDGVPAKQVRIVSYGAEKPIALGHTEADYQMNRRVDLRYEA